MEDLSKKIIRRWNDVMYCICVEHVTIGTRYSEMWLGEKEIHITSLINEAEYWLSCYYETGHVRCDDRFLGKYEYKTWVQETGKLKRLIKFLRSIGNYTLEIGELE